MKNELKQKQAGRDRVGRKLVDSVLGTSSGIIVSVALHHTSDNEHTNIAACHVVPCVYGKVIKKYNFRILKACCIIPPTMSIQI